MVVLLDGGRLLRAAGVLILLFTILIVGTPIFLSMALTGGIAFFILLGGGLDSQTQLAPLTYVRLMSPALTAVPYFIIGAGLLTAGGFSDKLFTFFRQWLPGVRGKLALVTVLPVQCSQPVPGPARLVRPPSPLLLSRQCSPETMIKD